MISIYEYKAVLDDEIKKGESICGSVQPISERCDLDSSETEDVSAAGEKKEQKKYKFFTVPQMMLPLYVNPHTVSDPLDYPSVLLYHAVGSGKTCTALKIFNNFRCNPYKKVWVTNPNLAAQLLSGAAGKSDVRSCWDGPSNVFVSKDDIKDKDLNENQILVLTYKQFAEIFYRSTTKEGAIRLNRYPSFWKGPDGKPLPEKYRYYITDKHHGGKRKGKRTEGWEALKGTDKDFDPLENTIVIIDEAHQLASVKGNEMAVVKNAIRDSKQNPNGKGVKMVLMTATPITDDPMTAINLLNLLIPYKYGLRYKAQVEGKPEEYEELSGLPVDEKTFREMYWKDDASKKQFINIIKGLISYYDPSTNPTAFAQKIPGQLLISDEEQRNSNLQLQHEQKNNKFGIIKVILSEKDKDNIIKLCNEKPLDINNLEKSKSPMALLQKLPSDTIKKLKQIYGVPVSYSANDFIDIAFTSKFIRDPEIIKAIIIKSLKAMPYQCMQDISATGNPPTWQNRDTKSMKPFKSSSVKVNALVRQIMNIDEKDIRSVGHVTKHMIYSSGKLYQNGQYPTVPKRLFEALFKQKIIPFHAYTSDKDLDNLLKKANLTLTRKGNDLVLCPLYSEEDVKLPDPLENNIFFMKNPGSQKSKAEEEQFKEKIEAIWNDHHYNNNGQLLRFIVLDTGYKEGISLFNIRHIHIMEPQKSSGDLTQAVGRAIRFCGHKGTTFEPGVGWKVEVYIYDVWMPDKEGGYTLGNKLIEIMSGLEDFTSELDETLKTSAFDYTLNLPAGSIELEQVDPKTKLLGSLWRRPPTQFDYAQFEKKYFYKMFLIVF